MHSELQNYMLIYIALSLSLVYMFYFINHIICNLKWTTVSYRPTSVVYIQSRPIN